MVVCVHQDTKWTVPEPASEDHMRVRVVSCRDTGGIDPGFRGEHGPMVTEYDPLFPQPRKFRGEFGVSSRRTKSGRGPSQTIRIALIVSLPGADFGCP